MWHFILTDINHEFSNKRRYHPSGNLCGSPVLRRFEQGVIQAERPFDITLADDPIQYYDIEAMIIARTYRAGGGGAE